jgi:hypothetical protein
MSVISGTPPKGDPSQNDIVPRFAKAIDNGSGPLSGDYTCSADFLSGFCREIFVGVGGTVVATMQDGVSQTYQNLASGSVLSGLFASVQHTGTTAYGLILRY